jgi:membrane-bound lytic murein transglycosylase A
VPAGDHAAARAFFEAEFTPYAAEGTDGPEGKFTAYAVQEVRGSLTKHGQYKWPLYKRPPDLLMIDLSKWIDDSGGKRIWGRIDPKNGELVKYYTRKEIRLGALDGQGLELVWLDSRVDALWTEIEGSGKAIMDDGSVRWIEFAGKNGRGYKAPGKLLKEMGEIQRGTMPDIRAWFDANPGRFDEIVDQSSSVVFFQWGEREGGIGSQDVVLTPRRSIAIDRAYVAHSTPIWVDTRAPEANKPGTQPWQRLMIAQDTGGGILGPVRGDLYMGDDRDATDIAGRMGGPGRWWLLLPKALRVR